MPERESVLILSVSAGAGHLIAARALEDEFRTQTTQRRVETVDVLAVTRPAFRRLYGGGYLDVARHAPRLFGWLHDRMDDPRTRHLHEFRALLQNTFRWPLIQLVRERRPGLIVNTHFLASELMAQERRAGRLDCPHVTVTTDLETHRMWVHEPCERYYTATEAGAFYLTTWGVSPERTRVTGIPVRRGFREPLTRAAAREKLGLRPERPLVLLLCGGFGVGPTRELLRELIRMPADADVVVLAGRNQRLQSDLLAAAHGAARPVRILGFTDAVHEWMRAADLAVSKPGGLTVVEALAAGLPLAIVSPIPGHEMYNSDYVLENGAGIAVHNPRMLAYRVGRLLAEPERLARLSANAAALARPAAATDIVADALSLMR
ncbi:MAG: glycosyltransferase [Planctomycetota bacterium]